LGEESVDVVNTALCGLCSLYDILQPKAIKGKFPIKEVIKLLDNPNVSKHVIPLLLRDQPKTGEKEDLVELISKLIAIAHDNKKACLILMEMATDEGITQLLVENQEWMSQTLPTVIDTVRLFAVVLAHKSIRDQIIPNGYFDSLLNNMIGMGDSSICSIICTFIRRIPLTAEFIKTLSKQGFIKNYIDLFVKSEDSNVLMSGILFIDAVLGKVYCKEFNYAIVLLKGLLTTDNPDLRKSIAVVCLNLSKHPESHDAFKENDYVKVFKKIMKNDENIKKTAKKFLKNIEGEGM
jgi:hypothetical protein